jgi:hypothetical protein
MIPRSPSLPRYLKYVSALNRQLTCSDFVYEQFMIDHAEEVKTHGTAFTGELFPANSFSQRFYFAMGKVPSEIDETRAAGRRNAFVVNYSLIEIFQGTLIELAQAVLAKVFHPSQGSNYFDAFWIFLGSPVDWFSSNEIASLDFLRLRRNCLVHRDGTANAAFTTLQRQSGTLLNRHWAKRRTMEQLDFRNASASIVLRDELIDVFNISRDLMTQLDELVVRSFPKRALATHASKLFASQFRKPPNFSEPRVLRKFKVYARIEFNLTLSDEEVRKLLSSGS